MIVILGFDVIADVIVDVIVDVIAHVIVDGDGDVAVGDNVSGP